MKNHTKRILLSVTGMSPAVVTETLYALVTEKKFIPTEIRVITTLQGKNKLMKALLGIEGGRKISEGAINEFITDYGQQYGFKHIHFDEECITVIQDKYGNALADIRTPEENEISSNQIVSLVGELCLNEDTAIHVSIAGGRKTMGFFLGYALSLYGREQDSLSHVLISEQFETLDNFFYPKPYSYKITDRLGKELNVAKAQVMLAEIPWVRLGLGVSDDLLHNRITYSESVHKAQQILEPTKLTFIAPIEECVVLFGTNPIKLAPRGYALLLSLALSKKRHIQCEHYDELFLTIYLSIYELIKSNDIKMRERLGFINNQFELARCYGKDVLSESRTDINKKVRKAFSLGKHLSSPYIPSSSSGVYSLDIEDIDYSALLDIKTITEIIKNN